MPEDVQEDTGKKFLLLKVFDLEGELQKYNADINKVLDVHSNNEFVVSI